jgi:hypothetical protein
VPVRASEVETAVSVAKEAPSGGRSFSDPGGDVTYPPTGSLIVGDDVAYPAPGGSGAFDDRLADFLGGSTDGDVVDLEAVFHALAEPPGVAYAALGDLDLLVRGRDVGRPALDDHLEGGPAPPDAASSAPDRSRPEHDDSEHERLPMSHDLDI